MLFPHENQAVKKEVAILGRSAVNAVLAAVQEGVSVRDLEKMIWESVVELGRMLMGTGLGRLCGNAAEQDMKSRGLTKEEVSLRLDRDYWGTVNTTLGEVKFPWFAYRDRSPLAATVTRTPAKSAVMPLYKHCRSSELSVEWESRLGSDHPFRYAQEALSFFTHGATHLEDTTIARHMVAVGSLVDHEWTYRTAEEMAKLLLTRATRDPNTDRPLLYASTDAHALRTYVDETWDAKWKMTNGVRLWCIDRYNGATIHLGGEYTWGDCEKVQAIFEWLRDTGRMPLRGCYKNGLNVQFVFVTGV